MGRTNREINLKSRYVTLTVKIRTDLRDTLRSRANELGRTMSDYVRWQLEILTGIRQKPENLNEMILPVRNLRKSKRVKHGNNKTT